MALTQRTLEVSVQLANDPKTNQPNSFAGTGANTVTLTGRRVSVRIQNSGTPALGHAQVDVFGMTEDMMNQLATLGLAFNIMPKNTLTITAGDDQGNKTAVFSGTIFSAFADYGGAPDVPFKFECLAGLWNAVQPTKPSSFPQATDVATVMQGFASQANLTFENNGVKVTLPPSYFSGNLRQQIVAARDAAGIEAEIIGTVLAIWPRGGSRDTPNPPLVARPPDGQMIGYPSFTNQGIIVRNVFDPRITFGSKIKVRSDVKVVNDVSIWAINKMDLALDANVPGGQWMQTIYAYNPGYAKPLPPP